MDKLDSHEHYMRLCLKLAEQAFTHGDSPVGSLLVYDQQIIGRGIESGKSSRDVTRHAEILAIQDAVQKVPANLLAQSTLYTTHEPCVMCSYVVRHHRISQIVYGLSVDYIGGHSSEFGVLTTDEVPFWDKPPQIISGVLKETCKEMTQRFKQINRASK